ncbi:MAG TPA: hypothetical protein PKB15_03950 [Acidimicrobiia bacterium]|nr:hypothetical protein [Acidimicrobiia bacterium]
MTLVIAISVMSCSSSKKKATGDLKRTQYCERYREFDDKVATVKPKEQKRLLEQITKAKSFPSSLLKDYTVMIEGYEKYLDGESVRQDEKKYEEASNRIARHAIDHCELLTGNSGSKI